MSLFIFMCVCVISYCVCFGFVGVEHVSLMVLRPSSVFQTASTLPSATASHCEARENRPPPHSWPFQGRRTKHTGPLNIIQHRSLLLLTLCVVALLSLNFVCGCGVLTVVEKAPNGSHFWASSLLIDRKVFIRMSFLIAAMHFWPPTQPLKLSCLLSDEIWLFISSFAFRKWKVIYFIKI